MAKSFWRGVSWSKVGVMQSGCFLKAVVCLFCMGWAAAGSGAEDYQARPGAGYVSAQFRYWQPAEAKTLRGVLVAVPAYNEDGRAWVDDPSWQALATNLQMGLITCYYQGDARADYSRAELGSGQALIDALRAFSDSTRNRDLFLLKFFLAGSSSGGQFAYSFAQYQSARTLGFVSVNGVYFTSFATGSGWRVPGSFWVDSQKEDKQRQANYDIWSKARRAGGLWSLGESPGVRLDDVKASGFLEAFARDTIKERLLGGNPLGGLKNLSEMDGWASPLAGGPLIEGRNLRRSESVSCSWLPGEVSAQAWLKLHQPPPAGKMF